MVPVGGLLDAVKILWDIAWMVHRARRSMKGILDRMETVKPICDCIDKRLVVFPADALLREAHRKGEAIILKMTLFQNSFYGYQLWRAASHEADLDSFISQVTVLLMGHNTTALPNIPRPADQLRRQSSANPMYGRPQVQIAGRCNHYPCGAGRLSGRRFCVWHTCPNPECTREKSALATVCPTCSRVQISIMETHGGRTTSYVPLPANIPSPEPSSTRRNSAANPYYQPEGATPRSQAPPNSRPRRHSVANPFYPQTEGTSQAPPNSRPRRYSEVNPFYPQTEGTSQAPPNIPSPAPIPKLFIPVGNQLYSQWEATPRSQVPSNISSAASTQPHSEANSFYGTTTLSQGTFEAVPAPALVPNLAQPHPTFQQTPFLQNHHQLPTFQQTPFLQNHHQLPTFQQTSVTFQQASRPQPQPHQQPFPTFQQPLAQPSQKQHQPLPTFQQAFQQAQQTFPTFQQAFPQAQQTFPTFQQAFPQAQQTFPTFQQAFQPQPQPQPLPTFQQPQINFNGYTWEQLRTVSI